MWACMPILTPTWVISVLFVLAFIFIPLGILFFLADFFVVESSIQYNANCPVTSTNCEMKLRVDEDMKAPVYFYYKLVWYFQNHRRYVKSRDDSQLQGQVTTRSWMNPTQTVPKSYSDYSTCRPQISEDDSRDTDKIYYPCGLIAASVFNDTFELKSSSNNTIAWRKNPAKVNVAGVEVWSPGIAWPSDVYFKFKNLDDPPGIVIVPKVQDEDFVVWMRPAALPIFRKLYRIIDEDLKKGEYTVVIDSHYDVSGWGGQKWAVLSTTSFLGGKNPFLGVAYLVTGGICLFFGTIFLVLQLVRPRKFGDPSYLRWDVA